jgi:hypothetical protein
MTIFTNRLSILSLAIGARSEELGTKFGCPGLC